MSREDYALSMKGLAVKIPIDLVRRGVSDAYEKNACTSDFKWPTGNTALQICYFFLLAG